MHETVSNSQDFERINALPRRVWEDGQAEALAEQWSPALLNANGLRLWNQAKGLPEALRDDMLMKHKIRLQVPQVMTLCEAWQTGGAFVVAPVGAGKTLMMWLLPLGFTMPDGTQGAKRPLGLIPGGMRRDMAVEFHQMRKVWRTPANPVKLESYNILGHPEHAHDLCNCEKCYKCTAHKNDEDASCACELCVGEQGHRPDVIIADESHKLNNGKAAGTRRVQRYMKNHPTTYFVGMTGTALRKSIRDIHRQLIWSLKLNAPIPINYNQLMQWSEALDQRQFEWDRRDPGVLLQWTDTASDNWLSGDDALKLRAVQQGYQERLSQTVGVIVYDETSCDERLVVRKLLAAPDPEIASTFKAFRQTAQTPDGWDVADPLSWLRHGTELGDGFYYMWDPRPPEPWLEARKAWVRHVADRIKHSANSFHPLDSEKVVAKEDKHTAVYQAWRDIEPTFKPRSKAVLISASVAAYATEWIKLNTPGLVWVHNTYMGELISKLANVPFFRQKGLTSSGMYIKNYPHDKSAILSASANRTGRNLQNFNKNLVVAPTRSGKDWEQLLGRTHRRGQTQTVYVDVLISCYENLVSIDKAITEANTVLNLQGHEQKILTAEWDDTFQLPPPTGGDEDYRWYAEIANTEE